MRFAYSSFLVHICSIGQKVHHTLIVTFPGSPDQWSGAILGEKSEMTDVKAGQQMKDVAPPSL